MKNKTRKLALAIVLIAVFSVIGQTETFAQGRGGQRPPNAQQGQRPPNAQQGQRPNRENSPYADLWKKGQRRPDSSRGQGGRPQGTFPRN